MKRFQHVEDSAMRRCGGHGDPQGLGQSRVYRFYIRIAEQGQASRIRDETN